MTFYKSKAISKFLIQSVFKKTREIEKKKKRKSLAIEQNGTQKIPAHKGETINLKLKLADVCYRKVFHFKKCL